ncbi:hypothetical protein TNCV_1085011 [Trichonephila clavipes]|nr:hypothetical protein TNCV_1085011 [Trichonephila clavipes]
MQISRKEQDSSLRARRIFCRKSINNKYRIQEQNSQNKSQKKNPEGTVLTKNGHRYGRHVTKMITEVVTLVSQVINLVTTLVTQINILVGTLVTQVAKKDANLPLRHDFTKFPLNRHYNKEIDDISHNLEPQISNQDDKEEKSLSLNLHTTPWKSGA